jgi:hypothetical protein
VLCFRGGLEVDLFLAKTEAYRPTCYLELCHAFFTDSVRWLLAVRYRSYIPPLPRPSQANLLTAKGATYVRISVFSLVEASG